MITNGSKKQAFSDWFSMLLDQIIIQFFENCYLGLKDSVESQREFDAKIQKLLYR